MSFCILNPSSKKPSNLAKEIGFDTYNKIIKTYYNDEYIKSLEYENALPYYNPFVLDENNDFKLFKHSKEKVTPTYTKHKYVPITSLNNLTDVVILPIQTIVHNRQYDIPYAVGIKGNIVRIESYDDIGVSINAIGEEPAIYIETKLEQLNKALNSKYVSINQAINDLIYNELSESDKTKLLKLLKADLTIEETLSSSDINATAINKAIITNNFHLNKVINKFINSNEVYASVEQNKVINVINTMNSEVRFDESIALDPDNPAIKLTDPLTGQYILNHNYYLLKDANGNLRTTELKLNKSVTNELDIINPFNRYEYILSTQEQLDNKKFKTYNKRRWEKYLPKNTLNGLIKLAQAANQEIKTIDPYAEFENKYDRPAFVKIDTYPLIIEIVHLANEGEVGKQKILEKIATFIKDNDITVTYEEFNTIISGLIGRATPFSKKVMPKSALEAYAPSDKFTTSIDYTTLSLPKYNAERNLVDALRTLNFGSMAGTYIHGITQVTMAVAFTNNTVDEYTLQTFINDNSNETDKYYQFVDYAKELLYLKTSSPDNYKKLDELINAAIKTVNEFKDLAANEYSKDGETELEIFLENSVLTREYGRFYGNNAKENNLASKVDISVVFPNGKVFIIDIKSSTKNAIKAESFTSPSAERYNHVITEEIKGTDYKEKIAEGYTKSDQIKHGKQLAIYRKIYITKGIKPDDIETYIFFVTVEDIDKSKPINNNINIDGKPDTIDNIIDSFRLITVPNFSRENPDEQVNKSVSYETKPLSHLIAGDTLIEYNKIQTDIDLAIGKPIEEINRNRKSDENIETLEQIGLNQHNVKADIFKSEKEDIKARIITYLEDVEKRIRTSKSTQLTDADKNSKLKDLSQLKIDISSITDEILSIMNFIDFANEELIGNKNKLGLHDNMRVAVTNYNQNKHITTIDPFEKLNNSISEVQFIYDLIYQFEVLKDIRELDDKSGNTILDKSHAIKLKDALYSYDMAIKFYNESYLKMLSEVFMQFHDSSLDNDYEIVLDKALKAAMTPNKKTKVALFTQEDLDNYKADVANGIDVTKGTKYNPAYGHINNIYDTYKHLKISAQDIEEELDTLHKDLGALPIHIMGAGMQNNRTIQLMFKMFKAKSVEYEHKTRKEFTLLDKAFQDYTKAVGTSSDMRELYGHILERKKRKRYDNEKMQLVEDDVWQLIDEYNTDYMLERDELRRQREEIREKKDKDWQKKEREIVNKLKTWEKNNLHKLYKDIVYEVDNILDEEIGGKKGVLRQKLEEIDSQIFEIRSTVRNPADYSTADRLAIEKLEAQKKSLANEYDEFQKLKTGEDLELAQLYTKYKEERNKLITSELNITAYTKAFNEAKVKYKNDPVRLQNWIDTNTDLVLSDEFYNERAYYSLNKKIIWTLYTTTDIDLKDKLDRKYTSELLQNVNNHKQFINNINAFLHETNIKLEESSDDLTLEIMMLQKPYRDKTGKVNIKLMPNEVVLKIKELSEARELATLMEFNKEDKLPPKIDKDFLYYNQYYQMTTALRNLQQFSIRSEYYDIIDFMLNSDEYNGDMELVKQSKWWKDNHYKSYEYKYKDVLETEYELKSDETFVKETDKYTIIEKEKPISIWTRLTPNEQEMFKINSNKLSLLLKLVSKYNLGETIIDIVAANEDDVLNLNSPVTKSTNINDIINLLLSPEGLIAIDNILRVNDSSTLLNLNKQLDIRSSQIVYDGETYNTLDLINAVINVLNTNELNEFDNNLLNQYTSSYKVNDTTTYALNRNIFETESSNNTSKYYQRRPNIFYNDISIKKEYLKDDKELREIITDSSFTNGDRNGEIRYDDLEALPLKEKWSNNRYIQMMNDNSAKGIAIREFYTIIKDFYKEKQKTYPVNKRRGLIIPSRKKSENEMYLDKEGRKTLIDQKIRRFKEGIGKASDDKEQEGNLDEDVNLTTTFFGTGYNNNSIVIPTLYTQFMNADDVSLDIISSMQHFAYESNKYEVLNDIVDTFRMLNTAFINREKKQKVLERNSTEQLKIKKLAEQLDVEGTLKFQGKNQTSNIFTFLQTFLEQNFSGINNKPTYLAGYRVDKGVDKLMQLQSKASLGGFSLATGMKGLVNSLQASMSIAIEAAGGEFFSKSTIKNVLGIHTHSSLYTDQLKEITAYAKGRTVSVTHTGLMLDHYEAVQGNFKDSMGNNVSSGAVAKFFKSGTWFFYQYFGEYLNGVTLMNAFLEELKILEDGTVITWKDYAKRIEISKLSDSEFIKAKADFYNQPSLRSSIKPNKDGTELEVTPVNTAKGEVMPKWTLGDKRDIELRLKMQALSREINGAYAAKDKTAMQQYWWGRALIMYKKHLVPSIMRRFGNNTYLASQELGSVRRGYHTENYALLTQTLFRGHKEEIKQMLGLYSSIITGGRFGTGLSERYTLDTVDADGNIVKAKYTLSQVANLRKSLFEHAMIAILMIVVKLIDIDDDEDKKEVSNIRYLSIYLLDKLRREQNSLAFTPFGNPVADNWKNLQSPSAVIKTVTDILNVFELAFDLPFSSEKERVYQRDTGFANEGDLKLWIAIQKLGKNFIPLSPFVGQTPRTMVENQNR